VVVELPGGETATPVFPVDEIADDPGALFAYRGAAYAEGDVISLAGGATRPAADLPEACSALGGGWVVATDD